MRMVTFFEKSSSSSTIADKMLEVSELRKTFQKKRGPALDDVSFQVEKGAICGLLGHNGAGKSTALGIVLGMVYPDQGEVIVGGARVRDERQKALRKIGAIFETPIFYEYLSGWRNLQILSAYSGGVPEEEMKEAVEWVGLSGRIEDRVGSYSHGMRQRLALAQAILQRPELLVLDEPTDGVDPEGIVEFRTQLLDLRDRLGLTVLLSSHLLSEVEQVCDEVVILKGGKKIYEGKAGGIESERILYRIDSDNPEETGKLCESLGGESVEEGFLFSEDQSASDLLAQIVAGGGKVSHFSAERDSLEQLYLRCSESDSKPELKEESE